MQAVPLAKEQKDVLVNIILQLAEQSSQEIPIYEAATKEKLGITLKQLIEFILDLLLRQYVFLNMLPLLLFIYLMQKIYYFSLFFFK